jgi:hypothetical protein
LGFVSKVGLKFVVLGVVVIVVLLLPIFVLAFFNDCMLVLRLVDLAKLFLSITETVSVDVIIFTFYFHGSEHARLSLTVPK